MPGLAQDAVTNGPPACKHSAKAAHDKPVDGNFDRKIKRYPTRGFRKPTQSFLRPTSRAPSPSAANNTRHGLP